MSPQADSPLPTPKLAPSVYRPPTRIFFLCKRWARAILTPFIHLKPTLNHFAILGFVAGVLVIGISATAEESKYHDFDVIRDEALVPPYHLPPVLVSAEGTAIRTPEEWFNVPRPQILSLFGNLVYGVVPQPESPQRTTFEVVKQDPHLILALPQCREVRPPCRRSSGG